MRNMPTRVIIKKLLNNGWKRERQSGSHAIYKKDGRMVPVKVTEKEIPIGTLASISRITGIIF